MENPPQIDVLEQINNFNGESCNIYNESGDFVGKGRIIISTFNSFVRSFQEHSSLQNISDVDIAIKDIEVNVQEGIYSLKSILFIKGKFISFELNNFHFQVEDGKLYEKVDISLIFISDVDEDSFKRFQEEKNSLDWTNILIPPGCTGGDKATQADAFESLCQEIVQVWGAKSFSGIGKGADRGRDGTFKIEADSWIPITTNYSNSWILQCKYSNNYKNLEINEIYSEMVKVIMHKPDYYLLMTNRKVTNDFSDWLDVLIDDAQYFIPFKTVLIGRQQLEYILSLSDMAGLKRKYFR